MLGREEAALWEAGDIAGLVSLLCLVLWGDCHTHKQSPKCMCSGPEECNMKLLDNVNRCIIYMERAMGYLYAMSHYIAYITLYRELYPMYTKSQGGA